MTWLVQTRLINEPFSDPGLFLDFRFGRRALLFDLGDVTALSAHELLRVSHVFISHAHVDHFYGFDTLLRVCLNRAQPLHLLGPQDFGDRVAAKIAGYTWNLLDDTSADFSIVVDEFADGTIQRRSRFAAREGFARKDAAPPPYPAGIAHVEDDFLIEAEVLDHGTPSLAFALQEHVRVNVIREGLDRMALPVGPWLNAAKQSARRNDPDETAVQVDESRSVTLGALKQAALQVAPGQRVAYVVDAAPHEANIARAVRLARNADTLYVEAHFATEDIELAVSRRHLTATLAGRIARDAGVGQVIPFHFSPRYLEWPGLIPEQVQIAFRGESSGQGAE